MRAELTGVRRVDRPVPVLRARPLPGLDADVALPAHRAMSILLATAFRTI